MTTLTFRSSTLRARSWLRLGAAAVVAAAFVGCLSTGDTKLSQHDEGTRDNDFGDGPCGRLCAASERAGCLVPTNCEVNCINHRGDTPSACVPAEDAWFACASERERAECNSYGNPIIDVCLPEALDFQDCMPPGAGFCSVGEPDAFGDCYDEACCGLELQCLADPGCSDALSTWESCWNTAVDQAHLDACDAALRAAGALPDAYLTCYLDCLG